MLERNKKSQNYLMKNTPKDIPTHTIRIKKEFQTSQTNNYIQNLQQQEIKKKNKKAIQNHKIITITSNIEYGNHQT